MQSEQPKKPKNWDWRADLAAARDVGTAVGRATGVFWNGLRIF